MKLVNDESKSIVLMTIEAGKNDKPPEGYRRLTCLEAVLALMFLRIDAEIYPATHDAIYSQIKEKFIVCHPICTDENPKGEVYVGLTGEQRERILVSPATGSTILKDQKVFLFCRTLSVTDVL